MSERKLLSKKISPLFARDIIIMTCVLCAAAGICFVLRMIDDKSDSYVPMLFILAVFLTSRFTNGYLFGIIASLVSVVAINFFFTYPYYSLNFTLSGYPLTILCTLAVSVITSTLTSQVKRQEQIKTEVEKEKTYANLLRAVSHDLRTPLTSILGANSAIIENDDAISKEERMKLLTEVSFEAQWLIRMVENLLTVTRMGAEASTHIKKEPEAVEELVSESVEKFNKRFPEFEVEVSVPDELFIVPMDAMLIEQVIINLLENAALHAKNATRIELSTKKDGDLATFCVRDNGCGIAANVLPHIFDGCLKQSYNDEYDKKRNMGIGLSVCYAIVRAHDGTMTAENGEEGGAVFSFTLPVTTEELL